MDTTKTRIKFSSFVLQAVEYLNMHFLSFFAQFIAMFLEYRSAYNTSFLSYSSWAMIQNRMSDLFIVFTTIHVTNIYVYIFHRCIDKILYFNAIDYISRFSGCCCSRDQQERKEEKNVLRKNAAILHNTRKNNKMVLLSRYTPSWFKYLKPTININKFCCLLNRTRFTWILWTLGFLLWYPPSS